MRASDALGRYGEDVAARYLHEQGLVVLGRNWRCREGEIDIIAREDDVLVVCEVKTRSGHRHGSPVEAVTGRKADRLRIAATRWMQAHQAHPRAVRFDVIAVHSARHGAAHVDHRQGVI